VDEDEANRRIDVKAAEFVAAMADRSSVDQGDIQIT
jgi:hypothetical protein